MVGFRLDLLVIFISCLFAQILADDDGQKTSDGEDNEVTRRVRSAELPNDFDLELSTGRTEFFAAYKLDYSNAATKTETVFSFQLFFGTEDLCQSVTLCNGNAKVNKSTYSVSKSSMCNDTKDSVVFVPGTKAVYVKKSGQEKMYPFYESKALFLAGDKADGQYYLTVHSSYDINELKPIIDPKPIDVKFDSFIFVIGSSRTCPMTLMQTGNLLVQYGVANQSQSIAPLLFDSNLKQTMMNISAPPSKFANGDCCENFYSPIFEPKSKLGKAGRIFFQKYTLGTVTDQRTTDQMQNNPKKSTLLLEIAERPCRWLRLCFEKVGTADGQACKDPKRVLDLLIRHGIFIPTDTEEAFNFAIPLYQQASNMVLKFDGNHLEFGHGPMAEEESSASAFSNWKALYTSAFAHSMHLAFNPKTDRVIYLVTPEECAARMVRPWNYWTRDDTIDISINNCKCASVSM